MNKKIRLIGLAAIILLTSSLKDRPDLLNEKIINDDYKYYKSWDYIINRYYIYAPLSA